MTIVAAGDPQRFDDFAAAYDRYCDAIDRKAWPLLSALGVTGGGRALDLGTGSGRTCLELAEHFTEVVGVDLSEPLLEIARARHGHPRVTYRHADLGEFTDETGFDLVYSSTAIHHVEHLDFALTNVRSLVRPGGWAVIIDNLQVAAPWRRWAWRHGGVYVAPLLALAGSVGRHRTGSALAAARFQASRRWVRHLLSDRWLTPEEFDAAYSAAFPSGRITRDGSFGVLAWHRTDTYL